jgi:5-methylcytosine-specific restriction enzyme A
MPYLPPSNRRPWLPEPTKQDRVQREARYHTHKWRQLSKRFLEDNPLCVQCQSEGRVEAASVTDHKIRVKDGADFWDVSNYQPLCHKCHNRKRNKERYGK